MILMAHVHGVMSSWWILFRLGEYWVNCLKFIWSQDSGKTKKQSQRHTVSHHNTTLQFTWWTAVSWHHVLRQLADCALHLTWQPTSRPVGDSSHVLVLYPLLAVSWAILSLWKNWAKTFNDITSHCAGPNFGGSIVGDDLIIWIGPVSKWPLNPAMGAGRPGACENSYVEIWSLHMAWDTHRAPRTYHHLTSPFQWSFQGPNLEVPTVYYKDYM